jgi:hypothetical protein
MRAMPSIITNEQPLAIGPGVGAYGDRPRSSGAETARRSGAAARPRSHARESPGKYAVASTSPPAASVEARCRSYMRRPVLRWMACEKRNARAPSRALPASQEATIASLQIPRYSHHRHRPGAGRGSNLRCRALVAIATKSCSNAARSAAVREVETSVPSAK